MLPVLEQLRDTAMQILYRETDYREAKIDRLGPLQRAALRVGVHEKHGLASCGDERRDVDGAGGFPHPALQVEHCESHMPCLLQGDHSAGADTP
jgi:hypothetical protein